MTEQQVATTNGGALAEAPAPAFSAIVASGIIGADEIRQMPIGTRVMLHDELRGFFWERAVKLSQSPACPKHLENDPETAFAVVRMALNWNMDYFSVAQSTYSPAAGKIGIEGKLAVGAMLGSRKVKSIKYEHGGEWDKVAGKFKMETATYADSGRPRMRDGKPVKKAVASYTEADELGLYVIATATMHDGTEISTPPVYLNACHPRNSTLWAANPRRQIMYVADRMLFQICCADILMGVHFDVGLDEIPSEPVDITPQATVIPPEHKPTNIDELVQKVAENGSAPVAEKGVEKKPDLDEQIEKAKEIEAEGKAEPTNIPQSSPADPTPVPQTAKFDQQQPGPHQQPKEEKKERAPTIKLTFRGKPTSRSYFLRDAAHLLRDMRAPEDYDALQTEFFEACRTIKEQEHQKALWNEITALLVKYEPKDGLHIHDPDPEGTVRTASEDRLV